MTSPHAMERQDVDRERERAATIWMNVFHFSHLSRPEGGPTTAVKALVTQAERTPTRKLNKNNGSSCL